MTFDEYKKNSGENSDPVDSQESKFLTLDQLDKMDSDVDILSRKTKSLESSIDEYFVTLMIFQMQLKVMHWGTESYSQHKAFMKTYDTVDGLLDDLIESYQGYHARIDFGCSCEIPSFSNVECDSWLNSITECLISLKNELQEGDLQNIVDEIMASVSKLKYLLTLK